MTKLKFKRGTVLGPDDFQAIIAMIRRHCDEEGNEADGTMALHDFEVIVKRINKGEKNE